jgi:hypothetical protein
MSYTAAKLRIFCNAIEAIEGRLEGRLDPRISNEVAHAKVYHAIKEYQLATAGISPLEDSEATTATTATTAPTEAQDSSVKLTITVENKEQADHILEALSVAEEEGVLDFPFNSAIA